MSPVKHTSYRLSDEAKTALAELAALDGTTRTAVLERLIRREARRVRSEQLPKKRAK